MAQYYLQEMRPRNDYKTNNKHFLHRKNETKFWYSIYRAVSASQFHKTSRRVIIHKYNDREYSEFFLL